MRLRRQVPVAVALAAGLLVLFVPSVFASSVAAATEPPPGSTIAHTVIDRQAGALTEQEPHRQFRSASLVKIMIAIDHAENGRDPGTSLPPDDLAKLERMLRYSDDEVASEMWVRQGWERLVPRVAERLGLPDTQPPADRRYWGYTATSVADVARLYGYLLDEAHPSVRDFVLGNLRQATRCAADGHDQFFGIPSAIPDQPWAIKQGWSGFPGDGEPWCVGYHAQARPDDGSVGASKEPAPGEADVRVTDIDLTSPALHSSGLVGEGDRYVVVFLGLLPAGSAYLDASAQFTAFVGDTFHGAVAGE